MFLYYGSFPRVGGADVELRRLRPAIVVTTHVSPQASLELEQERARSLQQEVKYSEGTR